MAIKAHAHDCGTMVRDGEIVVLTFRRTIVNLGKLHTLLDNVNFEQVREVSVPTSTSGL